MLLSRRYNDRMSVRVKICGITNREDAEAAIAAGADALGFILFAGSKRFIPIEDAIRIVEALPPFVTTVAVTVNAVKEFTNLGWRKQLKNFGVAQLHGNESPQHVKAVSKYLPVIKVFPAEPKTLITSGKIEITEHMQQTIAKLPAIKKRLDERLGRSATFEELSTEVGFPIDQCYGELCLGVNLPDEWHALFSDYCACVSAFMLDTPAAERGGTGRAFDWSLAVEFKKRIGAKPLVLSGGLNPENVAKAIQTVQPYAVDVASGVEASPGRKDHAKLRDFIQTCKSL
jgi:phosphoribosylanthranilate isomerase